MSADVKSKTYREWVEVAMSLEKRARWSEAREAWDAARRQSKTAKQRSEAAGKVAEVGVRAEAAAPPPAVKAPPRPTVTPPATAPPAAGGENPRAARAGLKVGDIVQHRRSGRECVYLGDRWSYGGREYTSPSDAANACAADLGMKSRSLNGWYFWGIEKRED